MKHLKHLFPPVVDLRSRTDISRYIHQSLCPGADPQRDAEHSDRFFLKLCFSVQQKAWRRAEDWRVEEGVIRGKSWVDTCTIGSVLEAYWQLKEGGD